MILNWYNLWHFVIIISYIFAIVFFFIYRNNKNLKINLNIDVKDTLFTFSMFSIIILLLSLAIYFRILELNPIKFTIIQISFISFYFTVLIAPVEELLFRGVITSWLIKKTNISIGLIVSAIIFGFVHLPNGSSRISLLDLNWKLALISGISGLLFGVTYLKTKSIVNPILLHITSSMIFVLFFGEL